MDNGARCAARERDLRPIAGAVWADLSLDLRAYRDLLALKRGGRVLPNRALVTVRRSV